MPDPSPTATAGIAPPADGSDISKYFDFAENSDVTVKFGGGHELKAHKKFLALKSNFFNAAFNRREYQFYSNELMLHEDDPHAIKGLIAWIYCLHDDGCGTYKLLSDNANWNYLYKIRPNVEGVRYAKYIVDLFVVANKYMVQTLLEEVLPRGDDEYVTRGRNYQFRLALHWLWLKTLREPTDKKYPGPLDEVARYVYVDHADSAEELRPEIVGCINQHMAHFRGSKEAQEKFQNLMSCLSVRARD
ncbi:uncharacterized protein LTR77_004937 [Saxophila tyrrhenica]|uniref:BTB domain-containing protein n=1 Tax=Saxophila tyrrhenica TaxID=1690608 RepID=A0AAV9PB93_9PEZI|nr:hypothetical protein LTR77_004937 [Saxophila tyrrhenica]